MAVYRDTPKCPKCGIEYSGIYRENDGSFIGDDFIRWNIEGHKCNQSEQAKGLETVEQAAQKLFDRGSYKNDSQIQLTYLAGARFGAQWQQSQPGIKQWVSVEDRLPEESGLVLICLKDSQDIYISFYKKDRKLFQVWGAGRDPIIDMKTTHWSEMPKPPMYKCREMDCDKDATVEEYPGNAFYVCDEHYKKYHPNESLPEPPISTTTPKSDMVSREKVIEIIHQLADKYKQDQTPLSEKVIQECITKINEI